MWWWWRWRKECADKGKRDEEEEEEGGLGKVAEKDKGKTEEEEEEGHVCSRLVTVSVVVDFIVDETSFLNWEDTPVMETAICLPLDNAWLVGWMRRMGWVGWMGCMG